MVPFVKIFLGYHLLFSPIVFQTLLGLTSTHLSSYRPRAFNIFGIPIVPSNLETNFLFLS